MPHTISKCVRFVWRPCVNSETGISRRRDRSDRGVAPLLHRSHRSHPRVPGGEGKAGNGACLAESYGKGRSGRRHWLASDGRGMLTVRQVRNRPQAGLWRLKNRRRGAATTQHDMAQHSLCLSGWPGCVRPGWAWLGLVLSWNSASVRGRSEQGRETGGREKRGEVKAEAVVDWQVQGDSTCRARL